jgi:hypothetical protein
MLQNSETERLGFVQVSTVRGSWGNLLKTTVSAAYGYSIEVFRERYYIGSITVMGTSSTQHIQQQLKSKKVQNGDTLIWVSLTPRLMTMDVPLRTTRDNDLVCKLTIMLKVDAGRASDFAILLNQNNDPVEMVKPLIINALQRYVRQRSYNELDNDDNMRQRVIQSLYGENKQYGLLVESVPHLSVVPDEHITKRIQITHEADTTELQDRIDQDRAFQQKAHQRTLDLQDSLHDAMKDGIVNQTRRSLNAGKTPYEIMEEKKDIAGGMYSLPPGQRPSGELSTRLVSGSSENRRMLTERATKGGQEETEDELIPGVLKRNLIGSGLRASGITVLSVRLSPWQRATAGVQALRAMLVCQIEADNGTFAVGDLITMIEGIAITDTNTLISILKEKHPATLSAQVLRGTEMVEITIKSIA